MRTKLLQALITCTLSCTLLFSAYQTRDTSATEGDNTDNKETSTYVPQDSPYIGGNLSRVAVHDPSIVVDSASGGTTNYYVFGTHITSAQSTDLANWRIFTNGYSTRDNTLYGDLSQNLSEPFLWAGKDDADCKNGFAVWAPDVIYNENYLNEDGSKGAYMIYFCTSSTYCRSAIAYAVSDHIDGGYTYKGTLVYSGFTKESSRDNKSTVDKIWTSTNIDELMDDGRIEKGFSDDWATETDYNTDYAPNAIDPTVFFDEDGKMWMTYGSWSGGIYLLEIDPATGDAIYPKVDSTTRDGRVIDKYFGIRIAGGHTLSGEGPYILYDSETHYYYLYTTYNYLDSKSGYNMRLFRATDPTGPYLDAMGNNAVFASRATDQYKQGIKVMGNYQFDSQMIGYKSPGHCSSLIDDDGSRYLFYHTRFTNGGESFALRVHQQFLNEDKWPVTAVFENRGDQIAEKGYEKEALVGSYEMINHGTMCDGNYVKTSKQIELREDGSLTGDFNGTWEQKEGSYHATFVIDDVTYKGVFFLQHDESMDSKCAMTFTAVGENNATIWGVKLFE